MNKQSYKFLEPSNCVVSLLIRWHHAKTLAKLRPRGALLPLLQLQLGLRSRPLLPIIGRTDLNRHQRFGLAGN